MTDDPLIPVPGVTGPVQPPMPPGRRREEPQPSRPSPKPKREDPPGKAPGHGIDEYARSDSMPDLLCRE
ncbi:hypothetical protein ACSSZE_08445 [Acidithiobacillus caldus]